MAGGNSRAMLTKRFLVPNRVNFQLGSRIYPLLVNSPQIKPNRLGAEAL